jgi:HAD superfamily hydrolase (TIGR01509 family)
MGEIVVRAVIFDLDGTLVDSLNAYYLSFNKGIGQYRLGPIPKEKLLEALDKGWSLQKILSTFFPSLDEDSLKGCQKKIQEAYLMIEAKEVGIFPDTPRVLKTLKERGLRIGVVTGRMTPAEREWHWLKELGLSEWIDTIVTQLEVVHRKPAPDGIIECAKRLGVTPEDCLFVGDSMVDLGAGRAAGAKTALVLTGVKKLTFIGEEKPIIILKTITELLPQISLK